MRKYSEVLNENSCGYDYMETKQSIENSLKLLGSRMFHHYLKFSKSQDCSLVDDLKVVEDNLIESLNVLNMNIFK